MRYETTRAVNDAIPADEQDVELRETLGQLVFARVTMEVEERPLREVLTTFARSLRVNLVPFYETEDRPAPLKGMVASRPISLSLYDVNGRAALEAIAAQIGPEVTWQLQRGIIEFGPRETLARQDARKTRVYPVTDLAHEAPYFRSPLAPGCNQPSDRLRPKDIVSDLVRSISEQCEPEAFLPEPPPTEDEIAEGKKLPQTSHTSPPADGPRPGVNTTATRNLDPNSGPVFVLGRWAKIQVKDSTLVVTAPDFVHRAIVGYPPPIPPRDRG